MLLGLALLGFAGVLLFVWLGVYNVAASSGHSEFAQWFLHFAMRRSVAAHARGQLQPDLNDPVLLLRGANYFRRGCAPCHGAPDNAGSPVPRGIAPAPPRLDSAAMQFSPNELYWIVKHGIKMTAMPAWPARERDDEVWAMVAFLEKLPALRPDEYRRLAPDPDMSNALAADQRPNVRAALPDLAQCAACHGLHGNGRGEVFPRLAGLSTTYIANALREFRSGARPSGFMRTIAAALSESEIENVSHYYSAQTPAPSTQPTPNLVLRDKGMAIAEPAGVRSGPACLTCHSLSDDERAPDIPPLTGQPARYIGEQLLLFRSGVRAQTPNARVMMRVTRQLSLEDIAAVAIYLSTPSANSKQPQSISPLAQ